MNFEKNAQWNTKYDLDLVKTSAGKLHLAT